ncbi:MAG: ribbon-helix-helix domain-containing protein [Proteobacteria bacterium]|nr:ribbon-helix-helix domain-containing protein [Pseudomonadota bacterium]
MLSIEHQTLINKNISLVNPDTGEKHRTSIRLEEIEWSALKEICRQRGMSLNEFCSAADKDMQRREHSRTSRIRTAILDHYFRQVLRN